MKKTCPLRLVAVAVLGGLALGFVTRPASAAPPAPVEGGFTLVVIPDTQFYALEHPETYEAQTEWIAENAGRYSIVYALHVGDITDKNTEAEWEVAARAQGLLGGAVPCALVPGNHDLGQGRNSGMAKHFPAAGISRLPTFGGFYDREPDRPHNSFHLFDAGGRKWLILALEFCPRDDVLRWAGDVARGHPDRSIIMLTHAYLRADSTRYDRHVSVVVKGKKTNKGLDNSALARDPAGFNDGEDMWRKLVSPNPNFTFVISGHTCVTGLRTDIGERGNTVHQMVVDYQNQPNGGTATCAFSNSLPT